MSMPVQEAAVSGSWSRLVITSKLVNRLTLLFKNGLEFERDLTDQKGQIGT